MTKDMLKTVYAEVFDKEVYVCDDYGFFPDLAKRRCFHCGELLAGRGFVVVTEAHTGNVLGCFCDTCVTDNEPIAEQWANEVPEQYTRKTITRR